MTAKGEHVPRRPDGTDAGACDVVGLVDELLARAVECGASDVHFEPTAESLVVKFRLDGSLSVFEELPKSISENVIARLKVLAHLLTYRNDIPQEGRLQRRAGTPDKVLDERLAVFPTIHGQRAVVRFFYDEKALRELDGLGLPPRVLAGLKRLAASNRGVVLMTGPAGSGKSTTLAALLRYIQQRFPGKSIVTLEDPVERRIEGVSQVQISPHGPMTFPLALRSLLRQDPEVLMVGEVRDAETARIVVEAGLTGHLLLTTLHSGTPAGALLRLLEMGIEPYQVTSAIAAVVNQRLVRRLCPHCKRPAGGAGRFVPVGCEACFHTGYRGRAPVAELVEMDSQLRRALLAGADLEGLEGILAARGHENILSAGLRLVQEGITTQEELNRVCGFVAE